MKPVLFGKTVPGRRPRAEKLLLIMKLTALFMLLAVLQISARGYSQGISLSGKEISLKKVFREIEKQSDYNFLYNNRTLKDIQPVNIEVRGATIDQALSACFRGLPLAYRIMGNTVVISRKRPALNVHAVAADTTITLQGKIINEKGEPVAGVSVLVKGSDQAVISDDRGNFVLKDLDENAVLRVSSIGYESEEVTVAGREKITITMHQSSSGLSEVVITGYNTIEKRKLTSAITTIKRDQIMESDEPTMDKMLQGRVPGMRVVINSGEPGAVPVVKIRGTSTLTGTTQPLWVLDGVILEDPVPLTPTELNSPDVVNRIGNAISGINPEDIESITVLKDASATAIYGVKAAGGVVVLTTKKGKKSKPVVNFKTNFNVVIPPGYSRFNMMNSKQRVGVEEYYFNKGVQYYNADADVNSVGLAGAYARYKARQLKTWQDFEDAVRKAQTYNTDWFDVLFRNALTTNNYLNVSGGGEKSTYYASLSYLDQQGADITTGYDRLNGLMKLNTQLSDRLHTEFYISGYSIKRSAYPVSLVPSGISSFTRPTPKPFDYALNTSRTFPLNNPDGSPYFYKGHNDFYLFNIMNEYDNSDQTTTTHGVTTRISLDMELAERLKAFAVLDYSKTNSHQETYYKANTNQVAGIRRSEYGVTAPADSYLPNGGVIFLNDDIQDYYMARLALEYKPVVTEKHSVELYAGGEYRVNTYRGDHTTGWGYLHDRGRIISTSENMAEALAGSPYLTIVDYTRKYASYYGVASYTFLNKYTINGNIRYDGSNLFGSNPKYRWKPAWSVSGRWNLSNEAFIKGASAVNALALRGSYGVQGSVNEQSTPQIIATFRPPAYWSGLNQLSIDQPANPNLRWEKTYNTNLGVDFTLFNNFLSGAVDVYHRKSVDLITNTRISEVNGFSYLPINFADVTNKGFEAGLQTRNIDHAKFKWSTTVNFSYNKNRVVKVNLEPNVARMLSSFPYKPDAALKGKPLNALYSVDYGYLDNTGVPHFLLQHGDTTQTATGLSFAVDDLIYSGPIEAPFTGGISNFFSYGGFRLSVFFTYGFGNYLRMQQIAQNYMYSPDQNMSRVLLKAWREPGDEAKTDIPNILNRIGSNTAKDFWNESDIRVVKGDYLRLKSVTLQYYLPEPLLNKIKLTKAIVQVEGNNLALFADKRLNGFDPETFVYQSLPNLTSFSIGLNVTF